MDLQLAADRAGDLRPDDPGRGILGVLGGIEGKL
jgi:hypothetical protein